MPYYLNLTPAAWQLWCFASVALALVMAVEADLLEQRIPNLLVGLTLVAGVGLHVAGPANGREGMFGYFPGALGGVKAVFGAMVGLAVFLPIYLAGAMGAGDVKFMAALGAFAGPAEVIGLALCVAVCGGLLALSLTLVRRKGAHAWANMARIFQDVLHTTPVLGGFDPATQTALRMPYALAFALGMSAYGYWRQSGHPALLIF